MIQVEYLNNSTLVHHYSDAGKDLLQVETGSRYEDAVDVVPCIYTYVEIDKEEVDENAEF